MAESLKPEWRVLTTENGNLLYHNDKTGEETLESPYLAQLNKYKNCDLAIWNDRREECVRFASVHPRPRINLDLNFGEAIGGRITVELFADVAPLAAYNFYCLCTNDFPSIGGYELKLKGSCFHHCIPGLGMLGGDITEGDGTGGMSIYGAPFEDENLNKPLDRAGLLLMTNDGLNLNLSRFLITSAPTPALFGHCSLFGRVVKGLSIIRKVMALSKDAEGNMSEMVVIANTSVAEDGPTPPDFTLPVKPSVRPNPMVPPVCTSLQDSNPVVGGSHAFTAQREAVPEENPEVEGGEAEPALPGGEEIPGMTDTPASAPPSASIPSAYDGSATAAAAAAAAYSAMNMSTAYSVDAAQASGGYDYYNYVTQAKAGEIDWDYDEGVPGVERRSAAPVSYTAPAVASSASAYMSTNVSDYRRGSMPKDADGRLLAQYLDLSTLEHHRAKKKSNKIPQGFKTWKEYGEFKKKEKRARQVHAILEDKYPVEYLERRRHK